METVITCKHLPNNKPILYYGLFINCLSEFPVLLPCLYYFFFFFFSGIEVSFKTCGLSIMRKKSYMQNPLLHIQIYLLLHMKRDWGNSNRNETSLIWTKKNTGTKNFSFWNGCLQDHLLGFLQEYLHLLGILMARWITG